jgi:hypothetical protein
MKKLLLLIAVFGAHNFLGASSCQSERTKFNTANKVWELCKQANAANKSVDCSNREKTALIAKKTYDTCKAQ